MNNDYANVKRFVEMASYSKLKTEKTENTEKLKTKVMGRKCRLKQTHIEQNEDGARMMHKIQFWSSFNCLKSFPCFFFVFLSVSFTVLNSTRKFKDDVI